MSVYSGYPRRPAKIVSGGNMKIINNLLLDHKIRNLEFTSPEQLEDAVTKITYPQVDCTDENKIGIFLDVLKNNTKIIRSERTVAAITSFETKMKSLQIFGKLG